jgi:hypothetical protein
MKLGRVGDQARLIAENDEFADWLPSIAGCHRNWGLLLCSFHLRTVKSFGLSHKGIYRTYCELELNLLTRARRRLVRQTPRPPQPPLVTQSVNDVRLIDFIGGGFELLAEFRGNAAIRSRRRSIRWGTCLQCILPLLTLRNARRSARECANSSDPQARRSKIAITDRAYTGNENKRDEPERNRARGNQSAGSEKAILSCCQRCWTLDPHLVVRFFPGFGRFAERKGFTNISKGSQW